MSKQTLSFSQRLQVHEALKARVRKLEGETCEYMDPNDNDRALAAAMPFDCTEHNVAGIRKECFGNLAKVLPGQTELQARVAKLERFAARLASEFNIDLETV